MPVETSRLAPSGLDSPAAGIATRRACAGLACLSRLTGSFSRCRTERPSATLTDQPLSYYAPRNTIPDDPVVQLHLRAPPGNRLEALKGDRSGQHSIRINAQWRICFVWTPFGAENVEIVDYH